MTVTIEFNEDQWAILSAKAAAQGITIEQWVQSLATPGDATLEPERLKREAAARLLELQKRVKPDPEGWTIRDYIDYGRR